MNDLDDWLNSIGLNESTHTTQNTAVATLHQEDAVVSEADGPNIQLTDEDLHNILAENGFQESAYEETPETTSEYEDLDAEEDEDWNTLESQGVIQEVTQDVTPPDNQGALQAVQSVNEEEYPEHNPDEQQVSADALEAFNAVGELQQAESSQVSQEEGPAIPPNSPTLLLNTATSRFSGTEWYNEIQKQRIILAGCGGIGSWTILQLARMNPAALFMYDDDIVEQVNMSGQLYCQDDIGKAKVNAMADMIRSYTTMRNIYAIKDKFTTNSEAGDIMICGFDNMKARNTFFHAWRKHLRNKSEEERKKCLYLDGIMKCLSDNL